MRTPIDVTLDELRGLENRRETTRAWARGLVPSLREVFEHGGAASLQMVADRLNAFGPPARRGGRWHRTQVQRLVNIGDEQRIAPLAFRTVLEAIARLRRDRSRKEHIAESYRRLRGRFIAALARHRAGIVEANEIQALIREAIGGLVGEKMTMEAWEYETDQMRAEDRDQRRDAIDADRRRRAERAAIRKSLTAKSER